MRKKQNATICVKRRVKKRTYSIGLYMNNMSLEDTQKPVTVVVYLVKGMGG